MLDLTEQLKSFARRQLDLIEEERTFLNHAEQTIVTRRLELIEHEEKQTLALEKLEKEQEDLHARIAAKREAAKKNAETPEEGEILADIAELETKIEAKKETSKAKRTKK